MNLFGLHDHVHIKIYDYHSDRCSRAEGVYQSMKAKYGVHSCHLLKINSVTPNPDVDKPAEPLPDPWSNFIKTSSLVYYFLVGILVGILVCIVVGILLG